MLGDRSNRIGREGTGSIVSEINDYHSTLSTDDTGNLAAKRLPFAVTWRLSTWLANLVVENRLRSDAVLGGTHAGFRHYFYQCSDSNTLIDPHRSLSAATKSAATTISTRTTSLPDPYRISSTPTGYWLTTNGNAVLHPRGSKYQTQFVVDGIPLTDNRSPSFGPEIEADDVDSMNVYTAGFPAEFGRKMGGVIEVNTLKDTKQGLHGQAALSGGSFDTGTAFAQVQNVWRGNTLGVSASGSMTGRYLNPVVPENSTDDGTTGDFSAHYERDLTANDRLGVIVRHAFSRFQIPNEQLQQAAGQREDGDNGETMGIVSYQHVFSSNVLGALRGMVRDTSSNLSSNPESTPVIAFLNNNFREGYFSGSIAVHHGRHEFKAGIESDAMFLHEKFSDIITDPSRFDDGTPRRSLSAGVGQTWNNPRTCKT